MVVVPYCGPTTTVVSTTGEVYGAIQPTSAQSTLVHLSQPAPMHAATASIASQVADPYCCGQTKVVATTGGVYYAPPQLEPGHVIHNGQASGPPVMVPI
jgi:hypothetical protein